MGLSITIGGIEINHGMGLYSFGSKNPPQQPPHNGSFSMRGLANFPNSGFALRWIRVKVSGFHYLRYTKINISQDEIIFMDYTIVPLNSVDWLVIILFLMVSMIIGLYYSKQAGGSLVEYFVAGRKMTWWLAGTSIVATSFASDTPLVIAGWMRTIGLERNWFWWGGIMGMMLCTFFYARLWRRANLITDVEFNELRYSGIAAKGLRIFHASYRSLIQNTLVMGWVTLAMAKIIDVTLDIPTLVFIKGQILPELFDKRLIISQVADLSIIQVWPIIGKAIIPAKASGIIVCLTMAAGYTTLSGLWGVMVTDFFQFTFAMIGVITLMFVIIFKAGGPTEVVLKANQAVKDGIVINQLPLDRNLLPNAKLPKSYQENPDLIDKLITSGVCRRDAENPSMLYWSCPGLTRQEVAAKLISAKVDNQEEILTLWQNAYTIVKAHFTEFRTTQKLIHHGFLIEDRDASGKTTEYFRLADISLSSDEILAQLNTTDIENKGAFMAAWHNDRLVNPKKITSFLPPFDLKGGGLMAVWSLIVFLGLQWWAGGEGGGFLAQRLFSCKNEKDSVMAMLWFNLWHFVLRPWPWIIVGIASLFMIPDITAYGKHYDAEYAYVVMFMKFLPMGLKGFLVAALIAAYMSTIATHVNFGASYVVNDLYHRFINKKMDEKTGILVSRLASVFLAILAGIYAYFSSSISEGWFLFFELMSGVGFVVLMRWYWWRISAWSELAAMASSLIMYGILNKTQIFHSFLLTIGAPTYILDEYAVRFSINIVCTTMIWMTVTYFTPPENEEHLIRFYRRVRPGGWWGPIAAKVHVQDEKILHVGRIEWISWGLGVAGLFTMLIGLGKLCFGQYWQALIYGIASVILTIQLFKQLGKMDWSDIGGSTEEVDRGSIH